MDTHGDTKMIHEKLDEYQKANQPINNREYLSASQWSHCDRSMWLNLRNATDICHEPKTLRTFKFGHKIEELIVDWLKEAGYKVSHQQSSMKNSNGGYIGSIDGIIFYENEYMLLEIKSANNKRFNQWIKSGVPESYAAQVSIYMHHSDQLSTRGNKLKKCLFVVMNKDTSEIYSEVFNYDAQYAELQTERMHNVIESEALPAAEDDYRCNMCNQKAVCKGETVSQINCRTCAHVSVVNGSFECVHGYGKICHRYVFHPQLIEILGYQFEGIDHENEALLFDKMAIAGEGVKVPGKATFTSEEFSIAHPAGLAHDRFVLGVKEMLDATIDEVNKDENKTIC